MNLKIHKVDVLAGGDAAPKDEITADGQSGVSFVHPMGEIFLQPLAGETDSEVWKGRTPGSFVTTEIGHKILSKKLELIITEVPGSGPQRIHVSQDRLWPYLVTEGKLKAAAASSNSRS